MVTYQPTRCIAARREVTGLHAVVRGRAQRLPLRDEAEQLIERIRDAVGRARHLVAGFPDLARLNEVTELTAARR